MKKWIKLLLIIICMGSIFYLSSDNSYKSTKKSDTVIIKLSNFLSTKKLTAKEQEKVIEKFVVPVRKGAHFLIYMTLGILFISFFKEFFLIDKKTILLAIFLSFLYACSDEIHQLFVSGRSGQFSDVLLDTVGASVGVFSYVFLYRFLNEKIRRNV